ncbi:collagen alpha-1(XII) chain-like [Conger conger]|uniref:collagen alpha-1(XII) chain-like n=1 Tax=Conger conger TaxID=82655 RepID=UPI002A5ADA79|nr:collagen alpha-1(XII) chain-like [Conger conger]
MQKTQMENMCPFQCLGGGCLFFHVFPARQEAEDHGLECVFRPRRDHVQHAADLGSGARQRAAVPCGLSACGGRREEGDLCEGKHPGCTAEEPAVATEYNLSVTARYSTGLSDPLIGRGTTLEALAGAKTLAESEETERSMKVTWQPAPGKVVSYRVTYRPKMGGKQLAAKVPGNTTSTVLKKLQPLTAYDITVHPIYKRGEGKASFTFQGS